MATKKFLDLTGLTRYDGKIKEYVNNTATTEAGKVETAIRKEFKVKDVDLTDNGKVALTLDANGKVGVSVDANVVKDADYATVKSNANNSAAAWGKFLDGTLDSATNPAPKLSQLATDANAQSYAGTAKSEAIAKAGELDTALEAKITTAYGQADAAVKTELIGSDNAVAADNTIKGAKKYADEKVGVALDAANNAQTAADAAQTAADNAQTAADNAQTAAEAAQGTADGAVASIKTLNETTIPGLNAAIGANTALIGTTKAELLGEEGKDGDTIRGAKKYAKDLADGLSGRIETIIAGGVAFKGVVTALPETPANGDLIIMGGDVTAGDVTYKKDYEYIYTNGAWYELGDSDKNAKAIAAVDGKADANKALIDAMDAAYKKADEGLNAAIETVDKAAVKSVVGGNSTYVTVTAGAKDDSGKVTLTVSDTIANTFDTISNVTSKISTAKAELVGDASKDSKDSATIVGAKKYADDLVKNLDDSFVAITDGEIDALFA